MPGRTESPAARRSEYSQRPGIPKAKGRAESLPQKRARLEEEQLSPLWDKKVHGLGES